ncbi:helix-turn-helix transcriptional regulator [Flavobacterium aquatile]|uniref:AraC family transcriptional regulator n=1 Tax=Flavobacterium aquatile LMG 4008 = ATCC 11947 TaxID=1453498 RepID=A0A095SQF1_9FLAO|nr:helix-turn-helix transcriptional regulator [Flavobacterium aquatile]KGD66901.1 AraC family transcriptional regulator [Flavobacterium aquatile LMG 4008 = ATCC 11947]OXA67994.1 AraC family transcriptional regulator [Flavobacterium aquatile LMG 4008 = ATCC 11947]GEC80027.1 AraC family transcriptional regulator [Flavobacterium aquatile]
MNYNTIEPNKNLSDFIKCYWTLEAEKETNPEKQRIVPDGCMEMIFHYGDFYKQYLVDGSFIIQPKCFVFGQITQPLDIEPTGKTGIFAIRFLPNGFVPFTDFPIHKMENKAVPLIELFGEEASKLEKEVLKAASNEERVKIVEAFFTDLISDSKVIDRITKSSVALILELKGQLTVEELSENLSTNKRQLERKFASVIGVSPKQLSKMIRIQSVLKSLLENKYSNLTDVAYENNFYDQAHFIKEFKEFTGVSPKDFYSENLKLSHLFSEKV